MMKHYHVQVTWKFGFSDNVMAHGLNIPDAAGSGIKDLLARHEDNKACRADLITEVRVYCHDVP